MINKYIELIVPPVLFKINDKFRNLIVKTKTRKLEYSDLQNKRVIQSTLLYDMCKNPDEGHYLKQYLYWINKEIDWNKKNISILDLGCGQGRITIPIGEKITKNNGTITGIDISPYAIEKAKNYNISKNTLFYKSDLLPWIKNQENNSIDYIICTEVFFFYPYYQELVAECYSKLRNGGKIFFSFRSRYFNLLATVKCKRWEGAKIVYEKNEGTIFDDKMWFSWHSSKDIECFLTKNKFINIKTIGIGILSGIKGDPLEMIARPSKITEEEQSKLFDLEVQAAEECKDMGRYILAIATKKE